LSEWNLQLFREVQEHLAAGLRPARLHEGKVAASTMRTWRRNALGVWVAILGNAGWVVGSVVVLVVLLPTWVGYAFVIGQAVVVGLLGAGVLWSPEECDVSRLEPNSLPGVRFFLPPM
jgi:hypothetical protein